MLASIVGMDIYPIATNSQIGNMHLVYQCEQKGRLNKPSFLIQVLRKIHWRQKIPLPDMNCVENVNRHFLRIKNSTPFPTTRYQIEADCGEWCCYFCEIFLQFCGNRDKCCNFSVLHNRLTAFAYSIRAPPSEI